MNNKLILTSSLLSLSLAASAKERPNIVVLFADDISAREFPIYGSDTWSDTHGGNTQERSLRASTPMMEQLAEQGCFISTCWGATISSPSRAQMMTGRYATITKWWHNGDQGQWKNEKGQQETYPLYESSPLMMGKMAQKMGYKTAWTGKTQMGYVDENIDKYGFDEGCYTPGSLSNPSKLTDFAMVRDKELPNGTFKIVDSGKSIKSYMQVSYYWQPSVMTVNAPSNTKRNTAEQFPVSGKELKEYGINTYGPDVEQNFAIDFMQRSLKDGKPFLIYHTSHLGHDSVNFMNSESDSKWVETPKVEWRNGKYHRTEPNITGDKGEYDFHNSLAPATQASQITYLDYTIWRYVEEFKRLGVADNTILIIAADNATSGYGKGSVVSQKGCHVPFMIYAPCLKMTKNGRQEVMMSLTDVVPTIAEAIGFEIPSDYEMCGKSLIPFLTTSAKQHRDYTYSYKSDYQMIRNNNLLCDGNDKWYDVSRYPSDLISFPLIDWSKATAEQKREKAELIKIKESFDNYDAEHDGPGGVRKAASKGSAKKKK